MDLYKLGEIYPPQVEAISRSGIRERFSRLTSTGLYLQIVGRAQTYEWASISE